MPIRPQQHPPRNTLSISDGRSLHDGVRANRRAYVLSHPDLVFALIPSDLNYNGWTRIRLAIRSFYRLTWDGQECCNQDVEQLTAKLLPIYLDG